MALRKFAIASALVLMASAAAPARASADWLFTPYIGMNWGGTAGFTDSLGDFEDKFEQRMNFGASLSWMGAGALGFEVDFGYSPNFFEDPSTDAFDANVTSLMGNLIIGVPVGGQTGPGIRPYVSGGAGLLRTRVDDAGDFFDIDENAFGINAGGGVMAFFSDHVGVRGDIRYFRAFKDVETGDGVDLRLGGFDFWRGSVGVAFRF
jgi:opacity protein-like surface antigen